jgi:hypothetical protein
LGYFCYFSKKLAHSKQFSHNLVTLLASDQGRKGQQGKLKSFFLNRLKQRCHSGAVSIFRRGFDFSARFRFFGASDSCGGVDQEPIVRLLNLQLQRQVCSA